MNKKTYLLLFLILSFLIFKAVSIQAQGPTEDATIIVSTVNSVLANSKVTVDVTLNSSKNVAGLTFPFMFKSEAGDTLNIDCDSIHWSDWVRSYPPLYCTGDDPTPYVDNNKKTIIVFAMWYGYDDYLPAGSGTVLTIYFSTHEFWGGEVAAKIDTYTTEIYQELVLVDEYATSWIPVFEPGFIRSPTWVKEADGGNSDLPEKFALNQNYPNPFNPNTVIRFALPENSWVKVEVFNILGQKITTLVDEFLTAGFKETGWDGTDSKGTDVASGIYFYKIRANDFTDIKKMVLLK